jgi:adenine-specific DNA-methyltransferase
VSQLAIPTPTHAQDTLPYLNDPDDHHRRDFDRQHRRTHGIYYTPKTLAAAIVQWLIRSESDTLLEPSFGGCCFLEAAFTRLRSLGCVNPPAQAAGCDVDPAAFRALQTLSTASPPAKHFLSQDFLSVRPIDFAVTEFDCLLGNPPFTRHHRIAPGVKHAIEALNSPNGIRLARTAGLWAHFVAHGLSFLRPQGRIGVVLPSSFLFADYAEPLRVALRTRFARSLIVRLIYPAFASEDTEERGLIVLAEGFGSYDHSSQEIKDANCELEVIRTIGAFGSELGKRSRMRGSISHTGKAYEALSSAPVTLTLGELVRLDIGVVTGANRIFVVSEKAVEASGLPTDILKPIIARTSHLRGLSFTPADHDALLARGAPGWLLVASQLGERHGPLRRYFAQVSRKDRRSICWFNKREKWYAPTVGKDPDALLTYMNRCGPRLVLLDISATCTNTLHRVWFTRDKQVNRRLVSLSLMTSYSQLSAELNGRPYGGGVLKMEPRGARQLNLVLPPHLTNETVSCVFDECDSRVRIGAINDATALADDFLLKPLLGAMWISARNELRDALANARALRYPAEAR